MGGEDPLEKGTATLPGESHGQGAWWATVHVGTRSQTELSD